MEKLEDYKNDVFDVIIQGGQSNAEGCGSGPTKDEYIPDENILYMNNDLTISIAEERIWDNNKINDFSLSFAKEYIRKSELKDRRKIMILRSAVGGTGWADHRWGMTEDLYLKMMEMIKASVKLNPENKLVAFLWHQGETDTGAGYDVHYAHLKELVESVRNTYGCLKLPFIAGDCVNDQWKRDNLKYCVPIFSAVKDVCKDIGYAGFAETLDLHSNHQDNPNNDDTIHFSRDALNKLGVRYFEIFEKLGQK
ncbi:MAG: sialate O-acetylesterase [Oscillospiraceae bacterium]|nr:sialate O-acetylesterase [Oscillospiraceae bacterium]